MAYDEGLADRVRSLLPLGARERVMFGGIGFMINGNLACGVQGEDLIVRVGPDAHEAALKQKNVRVFDYSGRPMKGWVFVDAAGVRTKKTLTSWVERGVAFAGSLPSKKK